MTCQIVGNHLIQVAGEGGTRFIPLPRHQLSDDALQDDYLSLEFSKASGRESDLRVRRRSCAIGFFKKLRKIRIPVFLKHVRNRVFFLGANHQAQIVVRHSSSPVRSVPEGRSSGNAMIARENTQGEAASPASPTIKEES